MSEMSNVKEICLKKWRNGELELDDRLYEFDNNFENWLEQIPETNRPTVLTLIENIEYYSHKCTNKWLKTLHQRLIESNQNISVQNTIYVFIKSKYGKTNSSNDYWTEYKGINKLNSNICITDMDTIDEEFWKYIENIVFIDDFSGSGKSFTDELEKCPNRYKGKNIFFVTINIMLSATKKINDYCKEKGINVVLLSAFNQEKAFERDLFENNSKAKEEIKIISKKFDIPKNEIFGFRKGEALIVFYNNTPNNTLGIIRYNTKQYSSLFPRKDETIPDWAKMQREKIKRQNANYNNKVGDAINE